MRTGYIYMHTSPSGLSYVGKSLSTYGKRWQDHVNAAYDEKYKEYNYPLQRAIRKYGAEAFTSLVLEDNVPEELLAELEVTYIEKFDTFYNGYNQTKGGEGTQGERSPEAKQRIAAANAERIWTDEMRQKMATSKTGAVLKPWFIVDPTGTRTDVYDVDKASYALQKGWHVGSFKNLFSKSRGVGSIIPTGSFAGYVVGNIGESYE
jgi:group I intron endonuclease